MTRPRDPRPVVICPRRALITRAVAALIVAVIFIR